MTADQTTRQTAADAASGLRAEIALRRAAFDLQASLSAPPGLTALLGPSGAGKSLTLQAIAGLTPVERGVITLNGRALTDTDARVSFSPRQRRVGYVPQSYALFPHLSVAANIAYGLPGRLDRIAREQRVADLLRLARLSGYERRAPRDLSGGEAQRVALARALAAEPEALLLDEPFSALDAPTRGAVRADMREIALASGLPTLLVTHDLGEALALASRLTLLVAGRIIAQGPVDEVTGRPTTALAAQLLGWGALLPVARVSPVEGAIRVTLACGQSVALTQDECAADAAGTHAHDAAGLALRPERLEVTRLAADAPLERDPLEEFGALRELRGMIRSVSATGPLWSARVALSARTASDAETQLEIGFSPREWQALGLAQGAAVALRLTPGAARLVAGDGAAAPDGGDVAEEARR